MTQPAGTVAIGQKMKGKVLKSLEAPGRSGADANDDMIFRFEDGSSETMSVFARVEVEW